MTEREKMLRGEQFETLDPQLSEDRRRAAALLSRLNALSMDAPGYREARFVVPELPERTWQVGFTVSNLPVTTWFNGATERIRTIAK